MAKPIISKFSVIDAAQKNTVRYTCYDDTVNEVEYVIHDNASGNIIIDKTVNTSGASSIRTFTLPAGLVHNRLLPYYLKIAVKNQSGKQSDLSDAVLFYCHEKPLLKFTDVDSTTVTTIPFPAFSFDVQYKNIEDQGETLSLYKYQLYDGDKNLLYEETHYGTIAHSFDLMGMTIQIHYVNANNAENYAAPINVSYSDDKIRFYWMVSDYATVKDGVLKFEIMATGAITVPSSGESKNYLWRTKPNEKLNVLKSLTGTAMNDPTGDDWYTQFLSTMSQKVGEAQTAATLAAQSAKDAQAVVDGLADTLANYYTKEEVNGFITLLQGDIAKVDGLAKFDVQYDTETQTIKFLNGDKLIKTITLNTDPSAEWVTAFNKTVDAKIDENVSVVQTELTEYKTSNDAAVKNLQDSVGNLPETLQSDYYNKQATNKLLESKAEKASVETVSNDLTVVKNTASGLQNSIDTINSDISDIQEQLKNVKPDPNAGREYDITYEDSKLNLLEPSFKAR